MKLLVSNYDKTMNWGFLTIRSNIPTIEKFMKLNNKFALTTFNNYSYMLNEERRTGFRPNYTSVSNGLVLFDENYGVKDAKYINQNDIKEIAYLLIPFINEGVVTLNEYDRCSMQNIINICGYCKSASRLKLICEYLDTYFPDYCLVNRSLEFNIRKKSNRVDSVDKIKEIENISSDNVYTFGNDFNDLKMIKKYNGYATPFANREVLEQSNGIVSGVKKLIKTIK